MKHLSANANEQQQAALAAEFQSLGDKFVNSLSKLQTAKSREFQFQAGDKLTIKAGFAAPAYFVVRNADGSEERQAYAAFTATVVRGTEKQEVLISAGQLIKPSILLQQPAGSFRKTDMRTRFVGANIDFREVNGVALCRLAQDYTCTIAVGCYQPDYDSWVDGEGYTVATHNATYGYSAEAAQPATSTTRRH